MLSAASVDLTFDDEEWKSRGTFVYKVASASNSWGVTCIGRGFNWTQQKEENDYSKELLELDLPVPRLAGHNHRLSPHLVTFDTIPPTESGMLSTTTFTTEPAPLPPSRSLSASPSSASPNIGAYPCYGRHAASSAPSSPTPRRRSSQQRVSLIAGRVSIALIEPSSMLAPSFCRLESGCDTLTVGTSTGPPSPFPERESYLGNRNISEFSIEGEIGRGAYGLVKRGREIQADGSLGPSLVIKQIIKSRILADCWKKHPKHGTIPIEIYVMSAISSTAYVLPPQRPWNPSRHKLPQQSLACAPHSNNALNGRLDSDSKADDTWMEGSVVKGHPNICPLLDFFEDHHYYYLILPSTIPVHQPNEPPPPIDLFDVVEGFPQGLPSHLVRSYLGQIADALCFLHSLGIVHRDVKDENVVLSAGGKCILIDFGSSGLVRPNGWDTFSGTLDYAGPEILRGEVYHGKEQDVWAFGVVAYVLLTGEYPFSTAAEAQEGLESPFANASIVLDDRCAEDKEREGEESDGGGALRDVATLVRACLRVNVSARPTFEKILQSRFLSGGDGVENY